MNQDLSIIELVLHASIVVKIVIAGLLLTSLFSWGLIFSKLGSIGKIKRRNEAFEQDFWSGKSLTDLYSQASNQAETGPLERLFSSGMREFMKLRDRRLDIATQLDG
ncbi:MAG: protein TolQ, partial [Burkholderiales bacterium]|nr:protein TolQ [Burkholderiales bacterium]